LGSRRWGLISNTVEQPGPRRERIREVILTFAKVYETADTLGTKPAE